MKLRVISAVIPLMTLVGVFSPVVNADVGGTTCAVNDQPCKRLEKLIMATQTFDGDAELGVNWDGEGPDAAVRFGVEVLGMENPKGEIHLIPFDLDWVPDQGGFRLRLALAKSDVFFFCRLPEGGLVVPPLGLLESDCKPERLGLGAEALEFQWDAGTGRHSMEWLALSAVINFLKNGNTMQFLHRNLLFHAGLDLETVWKAPTWPNGLEQDPVSAEKGSTSLRGKFGISGLLRSQDYLWELRGFAYLRPDVFEWDDWIVDGRVEAMRNFTVGSDDGFLVSAGLFVGGAYASKPETAVLGGDCVSDREHGAVCGGIKIEVFYFGSSKK